MRNEITGRGEVLLYSDESGKEYVSVVFKDETFWLTQKAMAELFDVQTPAISKHLKNIFADGELEETWLFPKWKQPLDMEQFKVRRRQTTRNSITSMPSSPWAIG